MSNLPAYWPPDQREAYRSVLSEVPDLPCLQRSGTSAAERMMAAAAELGLQDSATLVRLAETVRLMERGSGQADRSGLG